MLHEHQRTSAPSALNVSIKTAVWMVMCSEPAMARRGAAASARIPRALTSSRHLGLGDGDFLAAPFASAMSLTA